MRLGCGSAAIQSTLQWRMHLAIIGSRDNLMKNAIGISVFLLAALSLATPGMTKTLSIVTGEDLHKVCDVAERYDECVSYLEMVHKTIKAAARMNETQAGKLVGSCGPEKGIDTVPLVIALRLAWQDYAGQHPARLEGYAIDQVLLAYEARWPCAD